MIKDLSKLANLFKDELGKPLVFTPGQKKIFEVIVRRMSQRTIVLCATQYGKSLVVSLGILLRAIIFAEKWAIVAPTERKARIIMNYIIDHIFDNDIFTSQLEITEPLERLKRERSKDRLTFKRGGEIFILSADNRSTQRPGESLIGFGAKNVVLDESSLISDLVYANIKRMLGAHKDNFFLEIGNPFYRNHFLKAWQADNYLKIKIDCDQAIREGRFTQEFVDEMRKEAFFKVLYQCEFPAADEVDEEGWSVIVTDKEVEAAMERKVVPTGRKRLGVDIGRGGDYTVFVVRTNNYARVAEKNKDPDLMSQVGRVKRIIRAEHIKEQDVFIDDIGVGGGVVDKLKEDKFDVNAVRVGEKAFTEDKFANLKAEAYWRLREWVTKEGSLEKKEDWFQIGQIRYKEDSNSKLKIESKEDMRRRGLASPDTAEALMLTFSGQERSKIPPILLLGDPNDPVDDQIRRWQEIEDE